LDRGAAELALKGGHDGGERHSLAWVEGGADWRWREVGGWASPTR
jgi:hypothetical protein